MTIDGRMTDRELEEFLGIADCSVEDKRKMMATVTPGLRKLYDRMARLEVEVGLWQSGLGPRPTGVIICEDHRHGKAQSRTTKRSPGKGLR